MVAVLLVWFAAAPARAAVIEELWRSPYGIPRWLSVNPTDGSCWVIAGSKVLHLSEAGEILSQTPPLGVPTCISVNASDGSIWVTEADGGFAIHLSAAGEELARVAVGPCACMISVVSGDGSFWIGPGWGWKLAHYAEDGTLLWSGGDYGPQCTYIAANQTDGSCWVIDWDQMAHHGPGGEVIWEIPFWGFGSPEAPVGVVVNSADGTCWLISDSEIRHYSAQGELLWDSPGLYVGFISAIALDPRDGSVWTFDNGVVYHISAQHEILLEEEDFLVGYGQAVRCMSVDPDDGSLWLVDKARDLVRRFAPDLTELWQSEVAPYAASLTVDPGDGSLWVADWARAAVVHMDAEGRELGNVGGAWACQIAIDPADGSGWYVDGCQSEVVRFAANTMRLWTRYPPGVVEGYPPTPAALALDERDGSCWVGCYGASGSWSGWLMHYSREGDELYGGPLFWGLPALSVDQRDGTVWVSDLTEWRGALRHLASDGSVLCDAEVWGKGVAVEPISGRCLGWTGSPEDTLSPGKMFEVAQDGTYAVCDHAPFATDVGVDPRNGGIWVGGDGLHHFKSVGGEGPHPEFAAGCCELAEGLLWENIRALAVDPRDGTVWIADSWQREIAHLRVRLFPDVPDDYWAAPEISACVYGRIVCGYPDGTYCPTRTVTRDQMAVYLARATVNRPIDIVHGPYPAHFSDVPMEHWAYSQVEHVYREGIASGYEDGTYRPGEAVTRDQMAVFVARAMTGGDASVPTGPPTAHFSDVPTDHWAFKHVEYLRAEGVTGGYPDGSYRPEEAVTRDQLAVYVARAFDLMP
jgi:DNA-binding beta-propeller fold protein YncE